MPGAAAPTVTGTPVDLTQLFAQAPFMGILIWLWIFESRRRTRDESSRDERYIRAMADMSEQSTKAMDRQTLAFQQFSTTMAAHNELLRRLETESH